MKLVVDIPEDRYAIILDFFEVTGFAFDPAHRAIVNGTPLPKGHGRLIDADVLMKEFAKFVKDSNNSDFADVPTWNDAVSLVVYSPTIVKADKEVDNDESR